MSEWPTKSARRAAIAQLGCSGCIFTERKALRNGTSGWCNYPGAKEQYKNGKCKARRPASQAIAKQ